MNEGSWDFTLSGHEPDDPVSMRDCIKSLF